MGLSSLGTNGSVSYTYNILLLEEELGQGDRNVFTA